MSGTKLATVKIDNIQDIINALKEFPENIKNNVLRNATYAVARKIRDDAKLLAPTRGGQSRLRKSLKAKRNRSRDRDTISASVYSKLKYSRLVENGTSKASKKPFLLPAIMQNESLLEEIVRKEIDKQIKKHLSK